MEGEKQKQASSSSTFNEIFGLKESSAASSSVSRIFDSIIQPPSKTLMPEKTQKSNDFTAKKECVDNEDKSWNATTDTSNVNYQQQRTSHPCPLSSSIFYGGQDNYPTPSITKQTRGHSTHNRDGEVSINALWDDGVYY